MSEQTPPPKTEASIKSDLLLWDRAIEHHMNCGRLIAKANNPTEASKISDDDMLLFLKDATELLSTAIDLHRRKMGVRPVWAR